MHYIYLIPICLTCVANNSRAKGLVIGSVSISIDGTWGIVNSFTSTYSWIKCHLCFMCFALWWSWWPLAKYSPVILSILNGILLWAIETSLKSNRNWRIHIASMATWAQPTYSAFMVDMIVHAYFLLDQEMAPSPSKKIYSKVDLSSSGSFDKDESNNLKLSPW